MPSGVSKQSPSCCPPAAPAVCETPLQMLSLHSFPCFLRKHSVHLLIFKQLMDSRKHLVSRGSAGPLICSSSPPVPHVCSGLMAMPDQGVQSKCCGAALTHTSWPPALINFHRFDKIHTHINFSASVKLLPELASLQSSVWAGHCENIKFPQCQCCEKAFVQSMSTACVA